MFYEPQNRVKDTIGRLRQRWLQAKLPICMAFMDYEKKLTGVGMCFMPSGELEADMKIIMDYYATISPKFPENFALDERYA